MGRRDAASSERAAASSAHDRTDRLLAVWPVLLGIVLLAPLLVHRGYPLARDLVFVPRQPFTEATVGLGGTSPRAVPLDAVIAAVSAIVDGAVLGRIALLLALALAGWGVVRLTAPWGVVARVAASGFAVWNPFVIERMVLGQWALVLAYATLPWIVMAAGRFRRTGEPRALASVLLWSALASLTPTGGLLAVATALAAGASGSRRTWWLVMVSTVLQLPWVVPSFVGGASITADPIGAAVFAPGSDASGSPALALLGLGGIWDGLSLPATRHSPLAVATLVFVALVLVVGARWWWRAVGDLAPRGAGLGLAGLVTALVLTTPPGQEALRGAMDMLPGAGLLRDGQKFLAPFVLLVAWVLAAAVDGVLTRLGRHGIEVVGSVGVLLVLLPVLLIPDGAGAVWKTVRPVTYPAGLTQVVKAIGASPARSGVIALPWRSYRNFSWGSGTTSSDPLVRIVDRPVFASDDLTVGATTVRGESELAARLGTALDKGSPADVLPHFGIAWVVVYPDDPSVGELDLSGLRQIVATPQVRLYAVPGALGVPAPENWRRLAVVAGDAVALLTLLAGTLVAIFSRRRGQKVGVSPRC